LRALGAANKEPHMKDFADKPADKSLGKPAIRIVVSDSRVLQPPDLPPLNTIRWVASRKAQVVAGVHAGALSITEACRRYRLSPEEFLEWERLYKAGSLGKPRASVRALH
jgi:hypothetical protein